MNLRLQNKIIPSQVLIETLLAIGQLRKRNEN